MRPKIDQEYAAGVSGRKPAKNYGLGSAWIVYLVLDKYCPEQAWIRGGIESSGLLRRT